MEPIQIRGNRLVVAGDSLELGGNSWDVLGKKESVIPMNKHNHNLQKLEENLKIFSQHGKKGNLVIKPSTIQLI
jgi:hypothetical protein